MKSIVIQEQKKTDDKRSKQFQDLETVAPLEWRELQQDLGARGSRNGKHKDALGKESWIDFGY